MYWDVVHLGLNSALAERVIDVPPVESRVSYSHREEMPCRTDPCFSRRQINAVTTLEQRGIESRKIPAPLSSLIYSRKLCDAKGGLNVRNPVVVTKLPHFVVPTAMCFLSLDVSDDSMRSKCSQFFCQDRVVCQDGATFACGHWFDRME